MKKTLFTLKALGCKVNQYEAQALRDQFLALGYEEAKDGEIADICVVNTCTVTAEAEKDSVKLIKKLKEDNPGAKVVATGCIVNKYSSKLDEYDLPDVIRIQNDSKDKLVQSLYPDACVRPYIINDFKDHTRAFVKVQDGCDGFCTYCIIPYVRGRSVSRNHHEILEEINRLVEVGYKEIVITGIDVGDYKHPDFSLVQLIKDIDAIEGVKRLRISSIDPDAITEDLAEVILTGRSTCQSLHVSLQSGSNVILKKMNRKYSRQEFLSIIQMFKSHNKDFTFATDLIVGFPGETEEDFQESLQLLDETGFIKTHIFTYSKREGTRASLYLNEVPIHEKKDRRRRAGDEAYRIAAREHEKYIGSTIEVLTEGGGNGEDLTGFSDHYFKVKILNSSHLSKNEFVNVKIINFDGERSQLIGTLA